MLWVIFGSGPSMSQEVADAVRGRAKVAAVSNSYRLAPWADILVSYDKKWWKHYHEAADFAGIKYTRHGGNGFRCFETPMNGCNSGMSAMCIVRDRHEASRILLCGFDMHGDHFFGLHPEKLGNTSKSRFQDHIRQFRLWHGPEVINCTPKSALKMFPYMDLQEALDAYGKPKI